MTSPRSEPGSPATEVHLISDARQAHSQDLDRRMKRYLISMAIRTVCVILAVVVGGPVRWVFIVGAVILPYIAVVMANAVGERRERIAPVPLPDQTALPDSIHMPDEPARLYVPDPVPDASSAERVIPGSHERVANARPD